LGLTQALIRKVVVDPAQTGGLESAARDARYNALRSVANEFNAVGIMIAHTQEDQAETVLLGLARGSGTRSLAGMAADVAGIWRPLLELSRAEVLESLGHYGITPFTDPHNSDSRFTRVRVRHDVMPVLRAALGPGVDAALARTAALARDDADALDLLAQDLLTTCRSEAELVLDSLTLVPPALISRVIRLWLIERGAPVSSLTFEHITAVTRLACDPRVQGPATVAGGVEVFKASGRLRA